METLEFKNYNLKITLSPFINIIGKEASGKTKLLKHLINKINGNGILLDGKPIDSYDLSFLRKNIAAVLKKQEFKTKYVKEELLYYQLRVNINEEEAYKNINNFAKFFGLEEIIESEINNLSTYEKAYLKILSLLIINPSILGIDDLLTYLKIDEKMKIIKYAKENNICILNVTSNSEELLYGTDILILDHNKVVAYDKTNKFFENKNYLAKIGMNEPFIVELSSNLDYYDLLQKKYFNMRSLIDELWK